MYTKRASGEPILHEAAGESLGLLPADKEMCKYHFTLNLKLDP